MDKYRDAIVIGALVVLVLFGLYAMGKGVKECMDEGHGFYFCNGLLNGR
jgi:hypothetical protein